MVKFDEVVNAITKESEMPRANPWIEEVPEYLKIKNLISQKQPVIVVSGGAGTGKSTFIKWMHDEYRGKILAVAPTGIAALNIEGKTIHSMFNFPFDWIEPKDIKIKTRSPFKYVDILVIDEVSMVNANILDSIDYYLRKDRKTDKPFGGLTVLLVGDLFQLPPVDAAATRTMFKLHYNGIHKFISAKVLADMDVCAVELTKTFRQTDNRFVDLLLNIRQGKDLDDCVEEINETCVVTRDAPNGAVTLATRREDVARINALKLSKLQTPSKNYVGYADFVFKDTEIPAVNDIELKVGAQVMMLTNSSKWINGSVAEVVELKSDSIIVRVSGQSELVEVKPHCWEYFDYIIDVPNKRVERRIRGMYTQLPVQLGWAITIHKSQGQTISAVHVDLGRGTFAAGQAYVALSRCKSLETLSFAREFRTTDVIVDPTVLKFYSRIFPDRY